jgi:indolepyruvate ferredoxin oxidoreductase alpha subunit
MAHSRAVVETGELRAQNECSTPQRPRQWILLPANSRLRYNTLLEEQALFEQEAVESSFNRLIAGSDKSKAIVACGIAYNYLMENYPEGCPNTVVKISQYPLPKALIQQIVDEGVQQIIVMEEGQPVVEEQLRALIPSTIEVAGRLTGLLPRAGELNPDCVRKALGLEALATYDAEPMVAPRPPALCQGCGHRDMYNALNEVAREYPSPRVFADIGCYTLGAMPPFRAIDTCVEMGASITMAKGAADAGQHPSFAVIGDSTFTHSGITGLLDCVNAKANVVIVISDNLTTGMTGGQDSAGTGRIEAICEGIGVEKEHIRTVVPLSKNMEEIKQILREEIAYEGVSVVIPRRECIQTLKRHAKQQKK